MPPPHELAIAGINSTSYFENLCAFHSPTEETPILTEINRNPKLDWFQLNIFIKHRPVFNLLNDLITIRRALTQH